MGNSIRDEENMNDLQLHATTRETPEIGRRRGRGSESEGTTQDAATFKKLENKQY